MSRTPDHGYRRFMLALVLIWAIVVIAAISHAQEIPDKSLLPKSIEIPANPKKINPGQHVCVFPIHVTKELHAWVSSASFYFSDSCVFKALKLEKGFRVYLAGVPLYRDSVTRDSDMRALGWIMMAEVKP